MRAQGHNPGIKNFYVLRQLSRLGAPTDHRSLRHTVRNGQRAILDSPSPGAGLVNSGQAFLSDTTKCSTDFRISKITDLSAGSFITSPSLFLYLIHLKCPLSFFLISPSHSDLTKRNRTTQAPQQQWTAGGVRRYHRPPVVQCMQTAPNRAYSCMLTNWASEVIQIHIRHFKYRSGNSDLRSSATN